MYKRVEVSLLIAILATALALRVYDLRGVPPGAQHDEVFSANFATQIIQGARPVYWDQNGGVPVFHAYLVSLAFSALGLPGGDIVALRLVSVAVGLASIVFTYLTARRLFGAGVALVTGALLALMQWHLFESRVGLEPITLTLMASVTSWLWVRQYVNVPVDARVSPAADVLAGFALGLTMYTYQPAPLVALALMLFVAYLFVWRRAQLRRQWKSFARLFVVALLVAAPLPVHFFTTQGDASSRLEDLSSDLRAVLAGDSEPLQNDVKGVLGMLAFTGDPSFRYNLPGRPVFTLANGLLAYGGLLLALWRWREQRYALVVLWVGAAVLASAVTRASPSYLRSSAALPFVAMLPGIALGGLWEAMAAGWRRRAPAEPARAMALPSPAAQRVLQWGAVAVVIVLLAWEGASTAQDYFVAWAGLERVRTTYRADLAEVASFLDGQKPAGIVMLSARFPSDLDQGAMYLLQEKKQRYQWFNGRRVLVLPNDNSGQGVSYFIPASNASLGDGAALLQTLAAQAGSPDEHGKPAFTLYSMGGEELARLRARQPQVALHANAGGEVELIGVDASAGARNLHVLLYWRIVHRVPGDKDRSFFTHLLDSGGKLWTQEDRGAYPTSSWQDGDVVWQWYDLQLPADAPAADYWLDIGIYDANAAGQPRVPILGADGTAVADHVHVGPFALQ